MPRVYAAKFDTSSLGGRDDAKTEINVSVST